MAQQEKIEGLVGLQRAVEVVREFDPEMPAQTLMAFLYVANNPGMTMRDLETKLNSTSATTSRIVSRLSEWEKPKVPGLNWINREENPADRRYKIVTLTIKGRTAARKIATSLDHAA